MLRKSIGYALVITASFAFGQAYGQTRLETLAEARTALVVPGYAAADRTLLSVQTHMVIEQLFVHRDLKVQEFGQALDPVPRLAALAEDAANLENQTFHERLAAIFIDVHDLHTNYIAPAPLSCGLVFVPLRFALVNDGLEDEVIVSRKLRVGAEHVETIEVGMELVSIDDEPISAVLDRLGQLSAGANSAAMRYRGLQMLSLLGASTYPVPTENERRFVFRSGSDEIRVTLPWLVYLDEGCLSETDEHAPVASDWRSTEASLQRAFVMGQNDYQHHFNGLFGQESLNKPQSHQGLPSRLGVDDYQRRFNRLYGRPSQARDDTLRADTQNQPWSEVFDYSVINTPAGRLGYVQLKSFYWENAQLDAETVSQAFRAALETDLQSAESLVIDVRGNPGGHIVFSEKLVQLFAPRGVEPTTVQMLSNELNETIFREANGGDNRWSHALRRAIDQGRRYMEPLAITPPSEANTMGQVWFKPVVVLTDAGCYSACDLFAAGMQDNGAAQILGVDTNTGAGGANVMEYNTFAAIMRNAADNPFVALPFDQNFRVSWRQTIRAGQRSGQILENRGVESDRTIPMTRADVMIGESRDLMRAIHLAIQDMRPARDSGLTPLRGGLVYIENDQSATWEESVFGIDRLEVLDDLGRELITYEIEVTDEPTTQILALNDLRGRWSDHKVTLLGRLGGEVVFRVVRNLHWRGNYVNIRQRGLQLDFDDGLQDMRTVDLRGAEGSGWQVVSGQLRVGAGGKYDSGVLTRAFMPLNLSGRGASVTMDISLEAESLSDSLRIYATNPETRETLSIFAGSSIPATIGATFSLPTDWGKAELTFEFESDENWNLTGPIIDNIRIQ